MENLIPKISVCITTFKEKEETVRRLLTALNNQSLKPNEIIVIDAKNYNNCSRANGRNIAIKKAKNEIIAITDVGCVPHRKWLANLVVHLGGAKAHPRGVLVDVVAGAYKMVYKNNFEKAESVFLGTQLKDIDENFMPSARSMAFTKSIWKKVGGFPENLDDTAEDTLFSLKLIKAGAKFKLAKNAIVDWELPKTIYDFGFKIYEYAKGDAQSGIWWHPVKKFQTHNIKIMTVFLRYALFYYLTTTQWQALLIYLIFYFYFAFIKARWWGIILQFVSDFACIIGFSHGLLSNCIKRT